MDSHVDILTILSDSDVARFSRELAPGQIGTSAASGVFAGFVVARPDDIFALADKLAEEEQLEHMVTYRKNVTGVDNTLFISPKVHARHAARIKVAINPPDTVSPTSETASVSIHDGSVVAGNAASMSSGLLAQVHRFINLNRATLLDYWDERIDTDELRNRLKSI
jgi:hypothetical protein